MFEVRAGSQEKTVFCVREMRFKPAQLDINKACRHDLERGGGQPKRSTYSLLLSFNNTGSFHNGK